MAKSIPISIGHLKFQSKQAAKQHYSSILNSYEVKQHLKGSDFEEVFLLLSRHPSFKEKSGNGIKSILVDFDKYGKNKCFHVLRTDQTIVDFSIKICIDGKNTPFTSFSQACRSAIEHQIINFKREYFDTNSKNEKVKCDQTGEFITLQECHIDHRLPKTFSVIVHYFSKSKNINLEQVRYKRGRIYGNEFEDKDLAKSFVDWHQEEAKLRVIKKSNNLQQSHLARINRNSKDKTLNSTDDLKLF